MSFADTQKNKSESTFKKFNYFSFEPGRYTIRVLDNSAQKFLTHWINKSTVACLEDECPICKNNKKLIAENPNNFRNVKGWNPSRKVFFINVLDKTHVKVCPNCQAENYKVNNVFPVKCSSCDSIIMKVAEIPSNKVKVFSRGVNVFEQFNMAEESVLDSESNPIPIQSYDFTVVITGTGKEKNVMLMPVPTSNEPVEVPTEALFDLSKAVITLTAEEMLELQRGVSMKDIFAARKVTEAVEEEIAEQQISDEALEEIKKRVSSVLD